MQREVLARSRSFEAVRPLEIGDEPRLSRLPAQQSLRLRARDRGVEADEGREPAEVAGGLRGGQRDDGDVHPSPDDLGDVASGHALFGDRVIPGSRSSLLQDVA